MDAARPLRIALVDDDADYARITALRLSRTGLPLTTEHHGSGQELLDALAGGAAPDLVLLDVQMPGLDGPGTLARLRETHPRLEVVMVSAQTSVRVALDALGAGASDYLVKGEDDGARLAAVVRRAAERAALIDRIDTLRERLGTGPVEIVGESEGMARALRLVTQAVRGDLAVAVLGESGTGKELVARAVHSGSARADGPFVVLNCAAIPRELMESELFGHEKGSFTGAHARHAGVFEQADGGTLFLDEIGELAPELQAKLLRVLQEQTVRRVGGREAFAVDVRVVSATHRDLRAMVAEGTFREDLFYRLVQFPIALPPLRERGADVLLLAERFLAGAVARHPEHGPKRLSPAARRALAAYAWPGNVRELRTAVERAALVSETETVEAADLLLGDALTAPAAAAATGAPAAPRPDGAETPDAIVPIDELKRRALDHALRVCGGDVSKAARALGITRSTVYRMLKKPVGAPD